MPNTKRKPGLTLSEHRALGHELADLQRWVTHLTVTVGNRYPREPLGRYLLRFDRAVASLRSRLDGYAGSDLGIYYPGGAQNDAVPVQPVVNTRRGLTLDEHRALGRKMKAIQDRIVELQVTVGNKYPKHVLQDRLHRLWLASGAVRSILDDYVMTEHPRGRTTVSDRELCDIYYPVEQHEVVRQNQAP